MSCVWILWFINDYNTISLFSGTTDVNPDSSEVQRLQRLRDEVHRLKREESLLDRNHLLAQNLLKTMSEDDYNQKLAYLTHSDIRNIPEFGEETLLAVKAPYGSTLEVPDPDEVRNISSHIRIVLTHTISLLFIVGNATGSKTLWSTIIQ